MARNDAVKRVDDEFVLSKRRGKLREEVWETADGKVVKYNLAYINPRMCGVDNGRVLGYDNSHGHHHRHYMGAVEAFEFTTFEALQERFQKEVRELLEEGR